MEIDVTALTAEIDQLSMDDLKSLVLDAKVKQKVATKKYYNAETAKAARQRKAERLKAAAGRAAAMPATKEGYANLLEQINAEAAEEADRQLVEAETVEA